MLHLSQLSLAQCSPLAQTVATALPSIPAKTPWPSQAGGEIASSHTILGASAYGYQSRRPPMQTFWRCAAFVAFVAFAACSEFAPFSRNAGAMHYPKVVSAATGDRSHTIAEVSLRAQNGKTHHSPPRPHCGRGGRGGEGR
jgi:hypothetical protein